MTWSDEQKQTFELNRLSWDERVEAHWASDMYRRHAADLRGGRPCLAEHIHAGPVIGSLFGQRLVPRPADLVRARRERDRRRSADYHQTHKNFTRPMHSCSSPDLLAAQV